MGEFGWSVAPAIGAAFLASLVEMVEAFTIVLAVGVVQGWKPAMAGTAGALAVLALVVLLLRPMLALVPLQALQLGIGTLLLLFGLGWLRKAILRSAGVIPLHDEDATFAKETARLGDAAKQRDQSLKWIAGLAAFKAVLLEGLEVVFIVLAVGAGRGLIGPAAIGALAAFGLVLVIGAAVHRPLSRVPENALKLVVGVMLSSFGVFWTGEGLNIPWPGQDLMLLVFALIFLCLGALMPVVLRRWIGSEMPL
jgi:uncharacterized membrane protein